MNASVSSLPRSAAPAAKADLRVVRRRGRSLIKRSGTRKSAPLMIAAAIVVAAIVAGILLEQVVLAQSAFKLQEMNTRLGAAEARQEELLAQMAQLESPGRIERYARARLGMVDPGRVEYIVARVRTGSDNRLAAALKAQEVPLPGAASAAHPLVEGAGP